METVCEECRAPYAAFPVVEGRVHARLRCPTCPPGAPAWKQRRKCRHISPRTDVCYYSPQRMSGPRDERPLLFCGEPRFLAEVEIFDPFAAVPRTELRAYCDEDVRGIQGAWEIPALAISDSASFHIEYAR